MQEVKNFSSGVLSNGGAIQREQDREAKKERERQEKEARETEEKRLAEVEERRQRMREQRALEIMEQSKSRQAAEEERHRKAAEKAAREEEERLKLATAEKAARLAKQQDLDRRLAEKKEKEVAALLAKQQEQERYKIKQTQAVALLDDLSKTLDIPKTGTAKPAVPAKDPEGPEELQEPLLQIVKGEVHVPAFMPAIENKLVPQAHDLSELLPAPATMTVDALPQTEVQSETGEDLIQRVLNPGPTDSSPGTNPGVNTEASGVIKSKRGCERIQKVINEKRDLEKQLVDLQSMVSTLQDAVRKYEIEGKLVDNVMTIAASQKKPSELVSEAKLQMLKFLNTRSDEIDHIDKAICFNKYMSDPFYMQVFVQSNQPEQWQTMIESIYEAIGRPEPSFAGIKPIATHSPQPIRARTSTLGAPLASAGNPMDRIAQHLGNMGI